MYGTLDLGLMFFQGMVSAMTVEKILYNLRQKELTSFMEYIAVGKH